MCRALKVNRSTTYYRPDGKKKLAEAARHEKDLQDVKEAFEEGIVWFYGLIIVYLSLINKTTMVIF